MNEKILHRFDQPLGTRWTNLTDTLVENLCNFLNYYINYIFFIIISLLLQFD